VCQRADYGLAGRRGIPQANLAPLGSFWRNGIHEALGLRFCLQLTVAPVPNPHAHVPIWHRHLPVSLSVLS